MISAVLVSRTFLIRGPVAIGLLESSLPESHRLPAGLSGAEK